MSTIKKDGITVIVEGAREGITVEEAVKIDDSASGLNLSLGAGYQGAIGGSRFLLAGDLGLGFTNAHSPVDSRKPSKGNGTVVGPDGVCHDISGMGLCDLPPEVDTSGAVNGASLKDVNLNNTAITLRLAPGVQLTKNVALFGGVQTVIRNYNKDTSIPLNMTNPDGKEFGNFDGSVDVNAKQWNTEFGPVVRVQGRLHELFAIGATASATVFGATELIPSTAQGGGDVLPQNSGVNSGKIGIELIGIIPVQIGGGKKQNTTAAPSLSPAANATAGTVGMSPECAELAEKLATRANLTFAQLYDNSNISEISYTESDGYVALYYDGTAFNSLIIGTSADAALDSIADQIALAQANIADQAEAVENTADAPATEKKGFKFPSFGKKKVTSDSEDASEAPIAAGTVYTTKANTAATTSPTNAAVPTSNDTGIAGIDNSALAGNKADNTPITIQTLTQEQRDAFALKIMFGAPEEKFIVRDTTGKEYYLEVDDNGEYLVDKATGQRVPGFKYAAVNEIDAENP